jgi:Zn-dependent protease/CBS domain-containing protein
MFKSVLVLGHIRGIRIEIHVSWLIIFGLLLLGLSAGLNQQYPDWGLALVVPLTVFTILIFFASIVAHELGHSLVAIRRGVPVKAITLFIFGGVAQISRDSESPNDEFWIAIAGPAVSLVLAVVFTLLSGLTAERCEPVSVALGWLGLINFVVAVFNLVPGFPLDGGRVFRALVWKVTGSAQAGMRAAVMGGRLVAYTLFGLGLWMLLGTGNPIGGLWIMVIAWFLLNNAEASGRSFEIQGRLRGIRAADLAERDLPLAPPAMSVADWIENQVLPGGRRWAFVGDADTVLGLVSLTDVRKVAREQWPQTRLIDIMTPADRLTRVKPDTPVSDILQLISERDLNQLPMMEGSRLTGWIDRQRLLRTIEVHLEVRR